MKRTPDVCARATTISTVPLPSYPSVPSVRLPRICVIRLACVCARLCVYVCMYIVRAYVRACTRTCVHTTCVYSVPVRPATRSPSTTNTARTIVVSATAGYIGCPVQLGTSSKRAVAVHVCVCLKGRSGREEAATQ